MEALNSHPTKMNGVALKEYFEAIIKLNNDHILELMKQDKENVKEIFDTFNKNLDVHLEKLNNSHASIKDIASRNISTDKFDSLHRELTIKLETTTAEVNRRLEAVEKLWAEKLGEARVDDKVKYVIGVVIGAIITMFVSYLITGKI